MKKALFLYLLILINTGAAAQHKDYVDILCNYIKFPSISGNEREAGLFFKRQCEEKGLYTQELNGTDSTINFTASLYPLSSKRPNIILLNHIDVVDAIDIEKWKVPPYAGIVKDKRIWGRGSIDNKGMGIAQLAAVAEFATKYRNKDLPFNISILAVSGEETGSYGAREVAREWLDSLNIVFILGEGGSGVTDVISSDTELPVFGISSSEKTRIELKLQLDLNTSGHASVPPSQYALKEMIQALSRIINEKVDLTFNDVNTNSLYQLGQHERGIRGFVLRHHRFFLFRPLVKSAIRKDPMISSFFSNTISITDMSSPASADNQFVGTVNATFDCRVLPGTDIDAFIAGVKKKLRDKRIEVEVSSVVGSTRRTYAPQYFKALDESIKEIFPKSATVEIIFPATSDNSIFRDLEIPVYGLFPGVFTQQQLQNVHSNNENLPIATFSSAIKVYHSFLEKLNEFNWEVIKVSSAR